MTWILYAVFFGSGASALIFETLWFHQAGLAFGNSVWASSLVLAGFMAGMALGNGLAAHYGERFRDPVRAYAVFEIAIAVTGMALVFGLPALGPFVAATLGPLVDQPWLLNFLRFAGVFALLVIPSTAMGATLPLLTRALARRDPHFGRVLGRLYGWNTLGAVSGVIATEVLLVGWLGIRGSALAAGALNLVAALVAFRVAERLGTARSVPVPPLSLESDELDGAPRPRDRMATRWLMAAFLCGFSLLALEIVWFRFLRLFVLGNSLALAVMLAVVLTGISLGGFAASSWLRHDERAHRFASAIALVAGTLCVTSYGAAPLFLPDTTEALLRTPTEIARAGLPIMLPVSFTSGVLFTLIGAALRERLSLAARTTGSLTFANTVGAALGSLVAGFLLLPALGMEASFFVIALLYGATALFALTPEPITQRSAMLAAALLAIAAALFPFGAMQGEHLKGPIERWNPGGESRLALFREGVSESVIYVERRELGQHHSYRMLTNGYSMSGDDNLNRRYMKLYVYLPVAIHPEPRSALLISYGVGSTAKALTDTRELETIDVVDISRAVLESNHVVHPDPQAHPLSDPRVRLHVEDGRYFLSTTQQRFDLITSEPPPPREAGVVNLYTREYFQLMRERLNEGGVVSYWLPLHSLTEVSARAILHAFCDVFEDCTLWNGTGLDLMMVGTRNATGPVSERRFARQWQDPTVAPELRELGFERPEQLGALFIAGPDFLRATTFETEPLVDDYPKRVMAESRTPGQTPPDYLEWRNASASQTRFEIDPVIEHLWPARMRAASLPYFEFQDAINRAAYGSGANLDLDIAALHNVLTRSRLRTPVLWLLDSDADVQRILAEAAPALTNGPGAQFQLAVKHLADRHYEEAIAPLERAEAHPTWGRDAFRLRIYTMCLANRCDEAQALAHDRFANLDQAIELPPFWQWMAQTFALDPTTQTRLASTPPTPTSE